MSVFEYAENFFDACKASLGWDVCMEDGVPLIARSEPLVDITSVETDCEWMKRIDTVTAPAAACTVNAACYDEERRTAVFFATYHATHTGEGGRVRPTNMATNSHHVYSIKIR